MVSRLALEDQDFGLDRRDRGASDGHRSADDDVALWRVAVGLAELVREQVVHYGARPGARFAGEVLVPDVDVLKDYAFLDMRTREIRPLLVTDEDN